MGEGEFDHECPVCDKDMCHSDAFSCEGCSLEDACETCFDNHNCGDYN